MTSSLVSCWTQSQQQQVCTLPAKGDMQKVVAGRIGTLDHEICTYYQSTSNGRAKVLENLVVSRTLHVRASGLLLMSLQKSVFQSLTSSLSQLRLLGLYFAQRAQLVEMSLMCQV